MDKAWPERDSLRRTEAEPQANTLLMNTHTPELGTDNSDAWMQILGKACWTCKDSHSPNQHPANARE